MERGDVIDRIYLEHYLDKHRNAIQGEVLEIDDSYYTTKYGSNVERSVTYDVVQRDDVDIVGDLSIEHPYPWSV